MDDKFTNVHLIDEVNLYKDYLKEYIPDEYDVETINKFAEIAYKINSYPNSDEIIDLINLYYKNGLLSPLTLDIDKEFKFYNVCNSKVNTRFSDIYILDGKMYYAKAIRFYTKHLYDCQINKEIESFPNGLGFKYKGEPIYITHGGCANGDYIFGIAIKQSTINKHNFMPHDPIVLPVSIELMNNGTHRISVDAREPKLKVISEYYDIVKGNCDVKLDIRKYKKLNKNGKC